MQNEDVMQQDVQASDLPTTLDGQAFILEQCLLEPFWDQEPKLQALATAA